MGDGGSTVGAAVGWGMSALVSIISPIITDLLYKSFSYLGIDRSEKLKQLQTKVLQLELVLEAVEECPDKRLEGLLQKLKSAFYEAEDIFDDVEYYRLERHILSQNDDMTSHEGNWFKKLQSALPNKRPRLENQMSGALSGDAPRNMSKSELKKILDNIETITNEAHSLLNLPNHSEISRKQILSANSCIAVSTMKPPDVVIGRDKDRDSIVAMLHENVGHVQPGSNSALFYSIIGIHGIPGSGKSTLAQLVCAHEKKDKQEKKEGHFDLVMWVHVSQNFNVDDIFSKMLEEATRKPCPAFKSLNTLEQNLEEALSGKKILLVLDDVWDNRADGQQQELQKIVASLNVGKAGSKILVTSRTSNALLALGAARCIQISELDDSAFLNLFMHYALEGANIDDPDRSKFERIGSDIAKKLRRSPLAAKTVGGQLRIRPNIEFWMNARDRDHLNETMGALWWSYQQLDKQVRRCFSYCSILPRSRFTRNELVQLWLAQGFIRTTGTGEEDLEAVGHRFFEELVSHSFFMEQTGWFCSTGYFTVHDLLHDLAEKVAGSDYFRIKQGGTRDLPQDVRHLFIEVYDKTLITERISQMESLRTLIIHVNDADMVPDKTVFESIFMRMRKLRVLIVQMELPVQELNYLIYFPESIGKLKHLRYFGCPWVGSNKINLPSAITKLYHLQVLDFGVSDLIFHSKDDMSKLINLRSVKALGLCNLSIRRLGRLTSLQTAPNIKLKKEAGHEIQQLKHLNKLRGRLQIEGLENVESKEAAVEANLSAKVHLKQLILEWSYESCTSPDVQAEVLEGLCPPTELQIMEIRCYQGSRYPSWMVGQPYGPEDLQEFKLCSCSQLESIPEDSKLFTHVHSLRIHDCSWDSLPDNMERLMSLEELELVLCKEITTLPTLPQSLLKFEVYFCNAEFTSSCQTVGHRNWQKIKHIPLKIIYPSIIIDEVPGTDHGVVAPHL